MTAASTELATPPKRCGHHRAGMLLGFKASTLAKLSFRTANQIPWHRLGKRKVFYLESELLEWARRHVQSGNGHSA